MHSDPSTLFLQIFADYFAGVDLSDGFDELFGLTVFMLTRVPEGMARVIMAVVGDGGLESWLYFSERKGCPRRRQISLRVRKRLLSRDEFLDFERNT